MPRRAVQREGKTVNVDLGHRGGGVLIGVGRQREKSAIEFGSRLVRKGKDRSEAVLDKVDLMSRKHHFTLSAGVETNP